MNWHGYMGIENLNLNASQRQTLVAALRALGPQTHPQPACLNHWCTSLDGQAAIFEALFNTDHLTVAAFKNRLAAIFDVDPETITSSLQTHTWDSRPTPIVTFSRAGTDYLRFALFGGPDATWSQSGQEARAYIAVNLERWEPPV